MNDLKTEHIIQLKKDWWRKRRFQYNKGIIMAGITAFIAYCIVDEIYIAPHEEFEVTLFTIAFQGLGYLMMMGIANLFYNLGYVADRLFNKKNKEVFRKNLYGVGYWFSFCLPFLIPIILIFEFAIFK
jgi:hypothetical protein